MLLESKQQLEPRCCATRASASAAAAAQDVQGGRVDKRVLALLEYLSVSGLKPTVGGLPCAPADAGGAGGERVGADERRCRVRITAVNGVPIAGHQGSGSIADITVRKLLMLQGSARPLRIVSLLQLPGRARSPSPAPTARGAIASSSPAAGRRRRARRRRASDRSLDAQEWAQADRAPRRDPRPDGRARTLVRGDPRRTGASRRRKASRWQPLAPRPPPSPPPPGSPQPPRRVRAHAPAPRGSSRSSALALVVLIVAYLAVRAAAAAPPTS